MKNYNPMSEMGVSDQEVIQELGLDPELANTPKLNDVAFEKIYQRNVVALRTKYLAEGYSLIDAKEKAVKMAKKLRKEAEKFLKKVQKDRGY